jgi:hypothetical protein
MKKLFFALPALFLLASCGRASNENAKTTDVQPVAEQKGKALAIDTLATMIDWKATHKGGLLHGGGKLMLVREQFTWTRIH